MRRSALYSTRIPRYQHMPSTVTQGILLQLHLPRFSLLFFTYGYMHMPCICVSLQVCVHVYTSSYESQRSTLVVTFHSSTYFQRQTLSLNPSSLIRSAQQTLKIYLFLYPMHDGGYRCTQQHPGFTQVCGLEPRSSGLCCRDCTF